MHRLIRFGIGKHEIVTVLVAEFHLADDHRHNFNPLGRAEADVGGFAGADAADGGLHEGAQVARRPVLAVQHHRDVAVVIDRHSTAKVVCCWHKKIFAC